MQKVNNNSDDNYESNSNSDDKFLQPVEMQDEHNELNAREK